MKGEAIFFFNIVQNYTFFFLIPWLLKDFCYIWQDHIALTAVSKIPGNQFEFELALYKISIL